MATYTVTSAQLNTRTNQMLFRLQDSSGTLWSGSISWATLQSSFTPEASTSDAFIGNVIGQLNGISYSVSGTTLTIRQASTTQTCTLTQIPTTTALSWVQTDAPTSGKNTYVLWLEDGYWQICQSFVFPQVVTNFLTKTGKSSLDSYRTASSYSINATGSVITLNDTPTNTTLSFAYSPQQFYIANQIFAQNEGLMNAVTSLCKTCNAMVGSTESATMTTQLQTILAFLQSRTCKCANS